MKRSAAIDFNLDKQHKKRHKKDKKDKKNKKDRKEKKKKDKKNKKHKKEKEKDTNSGIKAVGATKSLGGGIDDIFGSYQAKKKERVEAKEKAEAKKARRDRMEAEERAKVLVPLRVDPDTGFNVYSEAQLGIDYSRGGDTPLCPFDCQCCF